MKYKTVNLNKDPFDYLVKRGIAFTVSSGRNTSVYTIPSQAKRLIFSENPMRPKTLGFIRRVKNFSEKKTPVQLDGMTEQQINEATKTIRSNIQYFKFSNPREGVYDNVVEMDLNHAYWYFAKKHGFISDEIYKEGIEGDKMSRLVALGARAAVKEIYQYFPKGDSVKHLGQEKSAIGRYVFFKCAQEVDLIMREVYERCQVLFYWVDAFFLDKSFMPVVQEVADKHGIGIKVKPISRIEVYKEGTIKAIQVKMKDGEIKTFAQPSESKTKANIKSHKNIISKFKNNSMIKFRKTNVYKIENGNFRSNIDYLKDQTGVYFIYDDSGKLVYIGHSTSNLKKTIMRHFQQWSLSRFEELQGVSRDRITYTSNKQKRTYKVKAYITKKGDAYKLEQTLIEKYRPRDNKEKLSAISDRQKEVMLQRFENAKAAGFKGKVKSMKYSKENELLSAKINDEEIPF